MYQNALEGVRVADFSWVVAGPFCTKLIGLMGAEVIKIESAARPQYKTRGSWFSVLNNSKKSCTINLASDQGKALARRLIAVSDVVVENFSTGVMDRLGLGYEALRSIKPDIIYISSSGIGRTGPGKNYLAYGTLLQGLSGWTSLFSEPNPRMEGMGIVPSWTDPLTGLWEALLIQAALYNCLLQGCMHPPGILRVGGEQEQVDPGCRRQDGILAQRLSLADGPHIHRVGNDHPLETELPAQDTFQDGRGKGGRRRTHTIDGRQGQVCAHDQFYSGLDRSPERWKFHLLKPRQVMRQRWQPVVGVGRRVPMPGEMFRDRGHPPGLHAGDHRRSQARHLLRFFTE